MSGAHPSLAHVAHRPWPLPERTWQFQQSWVDLAFIHYRTPAKPLARLLPTGVTLQEFDGSAWLGVVPFRMAKVSHRWIAPIAHYPAFPEINVRTYVEADGKPGVWFFSLDASSWPVVAGGRRLFNLPYFTATMRFTREGDTIAFSSYRRGAAASFVGRYRGTGAEFHAAPGTFEHWATERYCLYTRSPRGVVSRMQVHHAPWPLQRAEVDIEETNLPFAAGLVTLPGDPVCHYSRGVDVISYGPERVTSS